MKIDENSLKELLIRSINGDKASYQLFLQEASQFFEFLLKKKVFNPHDRDDVLQNMLLSLHQSLPTFDPKRPLLPWMRAIGHRRIVDYIRVITRKMNNEVPTEDGDVTFHPDPTNQYTDLKETLAGLPEELRKVLVLTKIQGLSTKEAAEQLGIKEGALRTRVSRAIKKLKKLLENENYDE
jgi:RNA polymerase sigma-70 factor, ECF subfamily